MSGVVADLVSAAAGTQSGTTFSTEAGLQLTGLDGTYTRELLSFAESAVREWRVDLDVREIELETVAELAGTRIGDPENRFATVATRPASSLRRGSAFVTIGDAGGGSVADDRGRIGGDGGSVGRNTLCRALASWQGAGDAWSSWEPWEPQTRDARGLRIRLELLRVSESFDLQVRALTACAIAAIPVAAAPAEPVAAVVAHLGKSTVQNLGGSNGTTNYVTWETQLRVDAGYSHSTDTNPSRVEVGTAGRYEIKCSVSTQTPGGNRKTLRSFVRVNGTTDVDRAAGRNYTRGAAYGDLTVSLVSEIDLAARDYLEIGIEVDDADDTQACNTINSQCELIVRRLEVAG